MPIKLRSGDSVLFSGDSITDCGRREPAFAPLGAGFVHMIADGLVRGTADVTIVNAGISGNRAVDLQARWKFDVIDHRPTVLTIMIGINDTWRRYDASSITTADAFEESYRDLLTRAQKIRVPQIVLFEPFLVPVSEAQRSWRDDLDPKIEVVRRLAAEFDTTLISTDTIMTAAAEKIGAAAVANDGVHPSEAGHRILADAWLSLLD